MRTKLLPFVFLLISSTLFSQNVYELDPIHSKRKLKEIDLQPKLFTLAFQKFEVTIEGETIKVKNRAYTAIQNKIALVEKADTLDTEAKTCKAGPLKAKLKGINKYKWVKKEDVKIVKEGFFVNRELSTVTILKGDYIDISKCYVILEDVKGQYAKGQIITEEDAIKNEVLNSKLLSRKMLFFRDKKVADKYYLGEANFLQQFAFMVNGRFNNNKAIADRN